MFDLGTLKEVGAKAGEQRLPGLSAGMAYNSMLALFPGLLAILSAIALFEPLQSTLYQIARLLGEVIPDDVRNLIGGLIKEILLTRSKGLFSVSFLGAIWAFSGVMSAAMAALDRIHEIPSDRTRPFWKAKLISLALSVGTIILLILASGVVFVSDLIVNKLWPPELPAGVRRHLRFKRCSKLLAARRQLPFGVATVSCLAPVAVCQFLWELYHLLLPLFTATGASANQIFLLCQDLFLLLFCGRYFQLYFGFMFCIGAITVGLTARSELL